MEDRLLVARVRRGDDVAFERLYGRYHRRITAYVNGMVHDHARAEDITQDVFVSALRRMRDTDRAIAFKPWIYEIAKNACIDQFRRSRRAEEVSYDAEGGLGSADYGRLVSTSAMPETSMDSKQQLDDLCGAFGGLSEAHHEILVMRELEGLSYREIGERLGMSRPSVESTLFRARRRLTEEYEELVSGARCQRIQGIIGEAVDGALGARDQRRLARHVSHCQGCRKQARVAGLHIAITEGRPVREKIAAFLPLPFFLRRWFGAPGADGAVASSSLSTTAAQWSAQLGSTVDPSWLKAAALSATVAVAGVGAGVAGRPDTPLVRGGDVAGLVSGASDRRGGVDDLAAARVAAAVRATAGSATATSSPGAVTTASGPAPAAPGGSAPAAGTPATGATPAAAPPAAPVEEVAKTLMPPVDPAAAGAGARPASGASAPSANPSDVSLPARAPAIADAVTKVTAEADAAAGKATGTVQDAAGSSSKKLGSALGD